MAQQKKELGGKKLSLPVKIVIVVFAIMMALSMMLPSLAPFFAGKNAEQEKEKTEETQEGDSEGTETDTEGTEDGEASEAEGDAKDGKDGEAEGTEDGETEGTEDGETEGAEGDAEDAKAEDTKTEDEAAADAERAAIPNNDTLKNYYDTYSPEAKRFEEKLDTNPDNLAALLNAGKIYMNWGYAADYAATNDEEHAYAATLVNKAVEYFDHYLTLNDSKSVRVDRALCFYYIDQTENAIDQLEAFSESEPEYPLIWANLGMLYELMGETEKANEAYKTAAECDPDDEYGAKTYSNGRLIDLNSKVEGPGDAGDASAAKLKGEESPEPGLTSTLAQDTGVGF